MSRASRPLEPSQKKWCPGGLLCEDAALLAGYRVPWSCDRRDNRKWLARCTIFEVPWERVVEFFQSRYGRVQVGPRWLLITGKDGVFAAIPRPSSPTIALAAPAARTSQLRVMRFERSAEIIVMRGE